ncbi:MULTISPECIES: hypothetical protein [unclassified Cyanobium]|jgi:hypothetical protein|uniref:hypothetical protein n=1 Tax=unclassified Cyanobium TaxID=2627006 RepID=UPI001D1512B3|nr:MULTISPECIES: hypothetical protein [unclassified Cyanobium]
MEIGMEAPVYPQELIAELVEASREFDATGRDPERNCWMAVHRHVHGVPPSEYDIREVPEDLYLAVLALRKQDSAAS